jgi:hypothetical protein
MADEEADRLEEGMDGLPCIEGKLEVKVGSPPD